MIRKKEEQTNRFSKAAGRWSGLGPYYAMFPVDFASQVVVKYSKPGYRVLDPFAGRASSVFAAASENRIGLGIEINPVGWVYGKSKLNPAPKEKVLSRLKKVASKAADFDSAAAQLPEFFQYCFAPNVLAFLLSARYYLAWKTEQVDTTLMSIILVYLHGKHGQALSNQMRQTKAMSPEYSIRWWKENKSAPPDLDFVKFLTERINWRYSKGVPRSPYSRVILGDSISVLKRLRYSVKEGKRYDLLFTSPPYYNLANYHYDQWLRLWMLNGPDTPTSMGSKWQGKFSSTVNYQELLNAVFAASSEILNPKAVVYVRTDAREFTFKATVRALREAFPGKRMRTIRQPFPKATQTALFGDKAVKPGEIDIILQ